MKLRVEMPSETDFTGERLASFYCTTQLPVQTRCSQHKLHRQDVSASSVLHSFMSFSHFCHFLTAPSQTFYSQHGSTHWLPFSNSDSIMTVINQINYYHMLGKFCLMLDVIFEQIHCKSINISKFAPIHVYFDLSIHQLVFSPFH